MWFGETDPPPPPAGPGPGPAGGPRPPAVRTGNTRLKHTDLPQQVNTAEENTTPESLLRRRGAF